VLINELHTKEDLDGSLVAIYTVVTMCAIVTIVVICKIISMVTIGIINTIA
jgi:hypothetical protein